jgi:hypothetical protein
VERDGKSLLEWIRIHSLRGWPGLAGPELGFQRHRSCATMPAFGYQPVILPPSSPERAAGLDWEAFPFLPENKVCLLGFSPPPCRRGFGPVIGPESSSPTPSPVPNLRSNWANASVSRNSSLGSYVSSLYSFHFTSTFLRLPLPFFLSRALFISSIIYCGSPSTNSNDSWVLSRICNRKKLFFAFLNKFI